MNLDAKALVGFFKEIEASRARQKAETEHQREIFKKARAKFFDPKAMRIVLQRRAMDTTKRDEQDYNVDCYEPALDGKKAAIEALEQGKSIREAAAAGGISTGAAAALAKGVQESSFVNAPHHPSTGEVIEDIQEIPPAGDTAPANTGGGHEVAGQNDSHIDDEPRGQAVATVSTVGDVRVSAATPSPRVPDPADADELHFPPGFRRTRAPAVSPSEASTYPDERAEGAA